MQPLFTKAELALLIDVAKTPHWPLPASVSVLMVAKRFLQEASV